MTRLNPTQLLLGVNGVAGQTIVLQGSGDLRNWLPNGVAPHMNTDGLKLLQAATTAAVRKFVVNPVGIKQSYYRAVLQQRCCTAPRPPLATVPLSSLSTVPPRTNRCLI